MFSYACRFMSTDDCVRVRERERAKASGSVGEQRGAESSVGSVKAVTIDRRISECRQEQADGFAAAPRVHMHFRLAFAPDTRSMTVHHEERRRKRRRRPEASCSLALRSNAGDGSRAAIVWRKGSVCNLGADLKSRQSS